MAPSSRSSRPAIRRSRRRRRAPNTGAGSGVEDPASRGTGTFTSPRPHGPAARGVRPARGRMDHGGPATVLTSPAMRASSWPSRTARTCSGELTVLGGGDHRILHGAHRAMGCDVTVVRRAPTPSPALLGTLTTDRLQAVADADAVIVALALTDETATSSMPRRSRRCAAIVALQCRPQSRRHRRSRDGTARGRDRRRRARRHRPSRFRRPPALGTRQLCDHRVGNTPEMGSGRSPTARSTSR